MADESRNSMVSEYECHRSRRQCGSGPSRRFGSSGFQLTDVSFASVWVSPILLFALGCGLTDNTCASACEADRVASEILSEFAVDYGRRSDAFLEPDLDALCSGGESVACVTSSSEFIEALSDQQARIVLLKGTYDVGVAEIEHAVLIQSATLWGARLAGTSYLRIKSGGVRVDGIRFEIGASPSGGRFTGERHGSVFVEATNGVILSNNLFHRIGENSTASDGTGIAVRVAGSNGVTIHDNVFRRSHAIAVKTDDFSTVRVRNNDFLNSWDFGGAGEVVQLGGAHSLAQGIPAVPDATFSEFAYNYVADWNLERELVSIKSSQNRIHHNYFVDSGDAIVVRMGNDNEIWANLLRGNDEYFPVRISGERNLVHGNVFCGRGFAVSLHTERAITEPSEDRFNSYWAAVDNSVLSNLYYGFDRMAHINQGYSVASDRFLSDPNDNVFQGNVMFNPTPVSQNEHINGLIVGGNIFVKEPRTCPID